MKSVRSSDGHYRALMQVFSRISHSRNAPETGVCPFSTVANGPIIKWLLQWIRATSKAPIRTKSR